MKESKDPMGDRLKQYEASFNLELPNRFIKVLRLDGKAFHTLLKSSNKPYDSLVKMSMEIGIKAVMREIGGICRLCYSQSDEATFLINDYLDFNTSPWFNNNIQKMCSVSASIMSVEFSKAFAESAYFDARVFIVPETELNNVILWRQFDATKNSINSYARHYFSHKSLQGLSSGEMQEKLFQEKGFNWNTAPTWTKRGFVIYKDNTTRDFIVDNEIPCFSQNKDYIPNLYYKPLEGEINVN
jgi:tRNA(His) 5'-end guanylyltransferase